jgi:hypothetical protein
MADIKMCTNNNCTLKEECYRFTAPVNEYSQSYFITNPKQKNGVCEEFWSNKGYAQILPKTNK